VVVVVVIVAVVDVGHVRVRVLQFVVGVAMHMAQPGRAPPVGVPVVAVGVTVPVLVLGGRVVVPVSMSLAQQHAQSRQQDAGRDECRYRR
jgi:hypothetical protein